MSEVPRRNNLSENTVCELTIREAISCVESMPASEAATEAVIKLTEALSIVADIVDGVPFSKNQCQDSSQALTDAVFVPKG